MAIVGSGPYTYEVDEDWGKLPPGWTWGAVSAVAADSQNRIYAFQRKDPPIIVMDTAGNYLGSWGDGAITDPHGIYISPKDIVYLTDRDDQIAISYTLDGKPLQVIGNRGVASDTGCESDGGEVLRAGGPFNKVTEMVPHPITGDLYITDGYRNCRVHRYSKDGRLIFSAGNPGNAPGDFWLPHSLWIDQQGLIYICDRMNDRVQVFNSSWDYVTSWTDLGRPNDIYMDAEGLVYINEIVGRISLTDKEGNVLARWDTNSGCHGIWADSKGDIYLAEVRGQKITKYIRQR